MPTLIGLTACAFLTTEVKSRLSLAGPLLTLIDVTIWVLSSTPIVSLMKRFVLTFPPSLLFVFLLLLDLFAHPGENILWHPQHELLYRGEVRNLREAKHI